MWFVRISARKFTNLMMLLPRKSWTFWKKAFPSTIKIIGKTSYYPQKPSCTPHAFIPAGAESLLHSEWSRQSIIYLTKEKSQFAWLASILWLEHDACTCNHNALQDLTWNVLHEFFGTRKAPLTMFIWISAVVLIVSGSCILGKLTKHFGCKSAAISIWWYVLFIIISTHVLPMIFLHEAMPGEVAGAWMWDVSGYESPGL